MIHNGNTKLVNLRETSVSLFNFFVLPVKSSILYDHSSGALPPGREAFPRRIKEEQLRLFLHFVIESSEIKKVIGRVKYHINSRFYRFDNVALARSICSIDRYFLFLSVHSIYSRRLTVLI